MLPCERVKRRLFFIENSRCDSSQGGELLHTNSLARAPVLSRRRGKSPHGQRKPKLLGPEADRRVREGPRMVRKVLNAKQRARNHLVGITLSDRAPPPLRSRIAVGGIKMNVRKVNTRAPEIFENCSRSPDRRCARASRSLTPGLRSTTTTGARKEPKNGSGIRES
jgi:hypothetical protein